MRTFGLLVTVAALGLGVSSSQATLFELSFNGGSSAATGQIDVQGGLALSGYLTVTAGPDQGTYNLVPLGSPLINGVVTPQFSTLRIGGRDDETFDNVVNVGSNPFLTTIGGLVFANNTTIGFNLWGNGPDSYQMFDSGPGIYLNDSGTASLVSVPEPSLAALAVLGGLLGAGTLRRKHSPSRAP